MERGANRAKSGSRPLDPGDFSFNGFGDLSRDEIRKIIRLGIRNDIPEAAVIEDAIFLPEGDSTSPDQPRFSGGVVKPDGQSIEIAQTLRKGGKRFGGAPEPISRVPEQEFTEDVVYLGFLFNHFGRVLLESLARVWYLSRIDPTTRVVFTNANSARGAHSSWLRALLTEFGIPPRRVWTADRPTRLRRLIVPEPLFEQFYTAHTTMIEPFHDLAQRVASDTAPTEQPLYLSRRLLSSRQRPVVGEAQLEELLRENGFRIAYPETLSLADQVRMFNQHRDIFSPIGSAAHGILFSTHKPRLHLLANRDDVPANFFLCSALADAPTTFVNCIESAGDNEAGDESADRREAPRRGASGRASDPNAGPQSRPQLVNFDAAVDYLRVRGFLTSSPRPLDPGVREMLDDRFDEAWIYARVRKATGKLGVLPTDVEAAALRRAARSWPVSLMLARYFARASDVQRTEDMATRFIDLLADETDPERLAYYRADVESIVPRIARTCAPSLSARLGVAVASRWPGSTVGGHDVAAS